MPHNTEYEGTGSQRRPGLTWPRAAPAVLGLVAGAVAVSFIWGRRASAGHMPYLDAWQQELARMRGEVGSAMLVAKVQARYDELYAQRPRFANRALRLHLERKILPGLALYRTLCEEYDAQVALAEVDRLFEATVGVGPTTAEQTRRLFRSFGRVPRLFAVFRQVLPRLLRLGLPAQGWEIEMVGDSRTALAFDVHRCFYLDVFTAYGAPELAALYCNLDDRGFAELPTSIVFQRTNTLARGGEQCDFRFFGGQ